MNNGITPEELEKIRQFTRKDITAEEIYTFPLILCDNDIDRDSEKFTAESLEKLAELFVGKTGIFDHSMSSKNQTARIYSAGVMKDESRKTRDGEPYTYVRAMAYMLRSEKNSDLIAEIEAGIKKETSVGCSVRSIKCSVCGKDIKTEGCAHRKGETYDGKMCCYLLCDPEDAYEWSFVAVPSQKNAGVTKSFGAAKTSQSEEIGLEIRKELTDETVAAFGAAVPEIGGELAKGICDGLTLRALKDLRDALAVRKSRLSPVVRQLDPGGAKREQQNNNVYII